MKAAFPDAIIGYSDHCKPDACADVIKTAYSLGAHVVEKHFTLDKTLQGNDHYHAMDPEDARKIIDGVAFVEEISGSPELGYSESEVAACDIPEGTTITRDMLTFKRPGTGISPQRIDEIIGKVAACAIEDDMIIQDEMIR